MISQLEFSIGGHAFLSMPLHIPFLTEHFFTIGTCKYLILPTMNHFNVFSKMVFSSKGFPAKLTGVCFSLTMSYFHMTFQIMF